MKRLLFLIPLFLGILLINCRATIHYVDNSLGTGSNNGTSWANAWHALSSMTGLAADDIVYISGGSTGNSQIYSFADAFGTISGYAQGTTGHPITYQIGQDSAHNGTVIFNQTSAGFSNGAFLAGGSNVVISGDAGDGVGHFALSGLFTTLLILQGTDTGVRIAYFNLGNFPVIGSVNPGTKIEVDHINIHVTYLAANDAIYFNIGGSTWDDSSVHDCTIELPYIAATGNGPDGIKPAGTGASFYNNTISSYLDNSTTSTEHMDGIQANAGDYMKAYNNRICNMSNYGMYWEAIGAPFNHLWIYNNDVSVSNSSFSTNSSGGLVVEQKVAGTMNDIAVINNTITDLKPPGSRALTFLTVFSGSSPATNSVVANNALVNSASYESDAGSPTATNTATVSQANAASYFVTYSYLGGLSNNMRLTSSATPLIGQGATESGYFTTDITGAIRTVPWDVGAYKYTGASGSGGSSFLGSLALKGSVILH